MSSSDYKLNFYVNNENTINSSCFLRETRPVYPIQIRAAALPDVYTCYYTINNGSRVTYNPHNTSYLDSSNESVHVITMVCTGSSVGWDAAHTYTSTMTAVFLSALPVADYVSWPKYYFTTDEYDAVDLSDSNYFLSQSVSFYGEGHTDMISFRAVSPKPEYRYTWVVNGSSTNFISSSASSITLTTEPSAAATLPVELMVTRPGTLLNSAAPKYYYDDVSGQLTQYSYYYNTSSSNINTRYRDNIHILPYPRSLVSRLKTDIPNPVVIEGESELFFNLQFDIISREDHLDPCYDKYGVVWRWNTFENGNKQDANFMPCTWVSMMCSEQSQFPKRWRSEDTDPLTSVYRSPLTHTVSNMIWSIRHEAWAVTLSDTNPEFIKSLIMPIVADGQTSQAYHVGFKTDDKFKITVTADVVTNIKPFFAASQANDWVASEPFRVKQVLTVYTYIAPNVTVYAPNKYILKSNDI